ncbi:MAG TPA: hypothetical protein VKD08_11870 [Ignavibacteriaceae bacterium]|jgi:hypothetical protein|nr:hypothetical protein [Ignavibacteriaceae bacterium]
MKMILTITFPHDPFNAMIKKGTVGNVLNKLMADLKPEAAYFSLNEGRRNIFMVVNVNSGGDYVKYAEPFFLQFNADIKYDIVITPEEIQKSGLEEIGKKYA